MGNPTILGGDDFSNRPITESPDMRVVWTVYKLRHEGQKVPQEHIKRFGMIGKLTMSRTPDGLLEARLTSARRELLGNLSQVELVSCNGEGLLLRGREMSTRRGVDYDPQVWWCKVRGAYLRGDDAA